MSLKFDRITDLQAILNDYKWSSFYVICELK